MACRRRDRLDRLAVEGAPAQHQGNELHKNAGADADRRPRTGSRDAETWPRRAARLFRPTAWSRSCCRCHAQWPRRGCCSAAFLALQGHDPLAVYQTALSGRFWHTLFDREHADASRAAAADGALHLIPARVGLLVIGGEGAVVTGWPWRCAGRRLRSVARPDCARNDADDLPPARWLGRLWIACRRRAQALARRQRDHLHAAA